jgi:hypothetical protein
MFFENYKIQNIIMNKTMLALLLGSVFYSLSFAQKITSDKVPVLVSRAFISKFPASNQQSWSMAGKTTYEVVFFNGNKKQSATYKEDGTWLETETEIKFSQLPHAVSAVFNKQFGGFTIQETTEVETAGNGTLYELTINKGSEGYEVQFSAKGGLVKKEAAKAED